MWFCDLENISHKIFDSLNLPADWTLKIVNIWSQGLQLVNNSFIT